MNWLKLPEYTLTIWIIIKLIQQELTVKHLQVNNRNLELFIVIFNSVLKYWLSPFTCKQPKGRAYFYYYDTQSLINTLGLRRSVAGILPPFSQIGREPGNAKMKMSWSFLMIPTSLDITHIILKQKLYGTSASFLCQHNFIHA